MVTIFRLDRNLSKAFVATSEIIGRPKSGTACRTQIEVQLTANEAKLLRENPLGNHHLIIPGNHSSLLRLACTIPGIEENMYFQ